jgi:hypothetical protein
MKLLWIVLGVASIAGCGGEPSCKDSVERAAKTMYGTSANHERTTLMIGKCEQDEWSAGLRGCVGKASDELELAACFKTEGQRGEKGKDGFDRLDPGAESRRRTRDVVAQIERFQQDMCSCRDKACADRVTEALTKWGQEMAKQANNKDDKPDAELTKRMGEIMEKYTSCMTKLLSDPLPTGGVLQMTELSPSSGDSNGGTYIRIIGKRFIADGPRSAKVYFGSRQGTVVRFASDTEIIVQAPGGKPGEVVDVMVIFDPGGEIRLSRAFTFVDRP